jgi:16S rRNA (cytidine1402-2'-O)-methyltransferase
MFEETVRGTLVEIKQYFETHVLKGEFVLCVAGFEKKKAGSKYDKKNEAEDDE